MKNLIKKFTDKIWEKYVIHKYVFSGLAWGEMTSYDFMGPPMGYEYACQSLAYWESKYIELGFIHLDLELWIDAGGYGREYQSLLKVKK